ncbi:MAG: hypothetical protein QNJ47_14200 [Nostocaceae cyanobacterium]|nr:hypothetical protein [Nostocaceae cyanobacterium]
MTNGESLNFTFRNPVSDVGAKCQITHYQLPIAHYPLPILQMHANLRIYDCVPPK